MFCIELIFVLLSWINCLKNLRWDNKWTSLISGNVIYPDQIYKKILLQVRIASIRRIYLMKIIKKNDFFVFFFSHFPGVFKIKNEKILEILKLGSNFYSKIGLSMNLLKRNRTSPGCRCFHLGRPLEAERVLGPVEIGGLPWRGDMLKLQFPLLVQLISPSHIQGWRPLEIILKVSHHDLIKPGSLQSFSVETTKYLV